MKIWKSKTWQLERTGDVSNAFLFGVNIFQYKWTDTNRRIQVSNLPDDVPVYTTVINGEQYEFAATERSNGVWNFYVYKF